MNNKILIVFDGKPDGVIDRMTKVVAAGVRDSGLEAICQTVGNTKVSDLVEYAGIILGSPCFFAGPTADMKRLMDMSWGVRGKLHGKVGAAFTASEHIAGGNEMALHAMIDFCLIHGMILQGDCESDYFGAAALNPSGSQMDVVVDASGECQRLVKRVAELVKRLG